MTIIDVADLNRGLLVAAGLEHEPVVVLESTSSGLAVRRLTAAEKVAYSERTSKPAFASSDRELIELLTRSRPLTDKQFATVVAFLAGGRAVAVDDS